MKAPAFDYLLAEHLDEVFEAFAGH